MFGVFDGDGGEKLISVEYNGSCEHYVVDGMSEVVLAYNRVEIGTVDKQLIVLGMRNSVDMRNRIVPTDGVDVGSRNCVAMKSRVMLCRSCDDRDAYEQQTEKTLTEDAHIGEVVMTVDNKNAVWTA